jgi:BTB And C-terminal Kelch
LSIIACRKHATGKYSFYYVGLFHLKFFQFLNGFLFKQVTPVIQACCTFLEHQLDPSNALGIAAFAEQHNCKNLMDAANKFVDQHFIQVRTIFLFTHIT